MIVPTAWSPPTVKLPSAEPLKIGKPVMTGVMVADKSNVSMPSVIKSQKRVTSKGSVVPPPENRANVRVVKIGV